jgi:hypothetical protein
LIEGCGEDGLLLPHPQGQGFRGYLDLGYRLCSRRSSGNERRKCEAREHIAARPWRKPAGSTGPSDWG